MAYGLTQSPLLVAATPSYFKTASSPTNLSITGSITLEAWVKFASMPADRANMISHNDVAYKEYAFELEKNGANYDLRLIRSFSSTPAPGAEKTSWNPSTGVWYHVATTHNPGTGAGNIVVNGSEIATTTQSGTVDSCTTPVTLGVFEVPGTALAFDGRISLVRIWNTIRTVQQISDNMCNVFGTATTNMQAEWSLDNVLTDASGNGYTLTNVNSVAFAADVPSTCAVVTISVSDQVNITESVSLTVIKLISVSDQLNITESVTLTEISNISVNDQINITESATVATGPFSISVSDQLNITESATVYPQTLVLSVSDQINITESVQLELNSFISVNDQITVSESASSVILYLISVSDQVNITESATLTLISSVNVSDQLNITENVSKTVSDPIKGLAYMRGQDQNLPVTMTKQDYPLGFKDIAVS